MGQVAAGIEAHAEDGVAGLQQGEAEGMAAEEVGSEKQMEKALAS